MNLTRLLAAAAIGLVGVAPLDAATNAVDLKLVAEGFTAPTVLAPLTDGSRRLLVVDQLGTVTVVGTNGTKAGTPFLDIRDRLVKQNKGFDERGLVGFTLHPKFRDNHRLFAFYSAPLRAGAPTNYDHTAKLVELRASAATPDRVDPATEKVLLEIDLPYFNHHGGGMAFGPDGHLYLAVGDGGNANDTGRGRPPWGNGQDTNTLMGKILRLDVDHPADGRPYGIPAGNPFARGGGRPEIYALGFRNPWGLSFDRGTGDLLVADVGQDSFEEVNIVKAGANHGWNLREGFSPFDPRNPIKPPREGMTHSASGQPLVDPILAYKNFKRFPKDPEAAGTSVTGGFVYHGKALPALAGKYVFGDWSRNWGKADGMLYAATRPADGGSRWSMAPVELKARKAGALGLFVWAFGQDEDGELYVLTNLSNSLVGNNGRVWKLVPAE